MVDISGDLTKAMRKLRRDVLKCERCMHGEGCTFKINFDQMVNAALEQVVEEFNLI